MNRLLQEILVFMSVAMAAAAQANVSALPQQASSATASASGQPDKQDLLDRIALYESTTRQAEQAHLAAATIAKLYEHLESQYADAGQYLKAEDAVQRAIAYLKDGSRNELAEEYTQAAILHALMGNTKQAERDEMQALRVRQEIGDPVGIALTWKDLAGLYDQERKFPKALGYAQQAYAVLADRPDVSADNRIAVRQAFGYALTETRQCARGIPMMQESLTILEGSEGIKGLGVGYGQYLLGVSYWNCGDRDHAADWFQRGTTRMKADYGWHQTVYVNAMRRYADFLRSTGQMEAAATAEAVINQADAVVDAQSLTGRAQGFMNSQPK
jgi:tetratricopeptide (TPR) repeat protein